MTNNKIAAFGIAALVPFTSLISHTWLPVSPSLFFFLIAAVCALFMYDPLLTRTCRIQKSILNGETQKVLLFPLLFVFYILFSQYFMGAPFTRAFGVWSGVFYLIVLILLSQDISVHTWAKKVDWFVKISALVYTFEAIARYAVSLYFLYTGENTYNWIYKFKFFGPMYFESNGTAIHLIILIFFTFWWAEQRKQKWYGLKILFIVLLGLTISRACMLAALIGFIYFYFLRGKMGRVWIRNILLFLTAIVLVFGIFIYPNISYDLSFISKFEILEQAINYYKDVEIMPLFFGVGISNSQEYLGIYAHNYFLVFLMETGIVGLLILLAMFYSFYKYTSASALCILIPFFFATASSTVTFLPDLYLSVAVMYLYVSQKKSNFTPLNG
ncbi:MAG: hypothetical protein RR190_00015 [Bacteroidales bacterium]